MSEKFKKLKMGNDWGTCYYAFQPKEHGTYYKHLALYPKHKQVTVQFPNGTTAAVAVSRKAMSNHVYDHSIRPILVEYKLPVFYIFHHGLKCMVQFNEVKVLPSEWGRNE